VGVLLAARGPLWEDDLGALTPVPRALLELDARLRTELGAPDMRYLMVVVAPTAESALTRCEALAPRLADLVKQGKISGYGHPARFLPSVATQQRQQRSEVDGLLLVAHTGQVDRHRLAIEQTRHHAGMLLQFRGQHVQVRGLQHYRDQCECGAPQLEDGGVVLTCGDGHAVSTRKSMSVSKCVVMLDIESGGACEQLPTPFPSPTTQIHPA